jgi:transcriptional regulator NrdR family protein
MNCPHCQTESNGNVLETRKQDGAIIRKRACGNCGKNFYSREVGDFNWIYASIVMKRARSDKAATRADVEPGPKAISIATKI